ncbi:protein TIFY 4B isoform X4 [Silene latifolia]|uniref:protein TIFY 4B isoform X4 n=1 Tax=Silene latifolia TaxID=37657 RepID=UPI003D784E47
MNGGATATTTTSPAVKSILYKPVYDLTEDDISQLTREDCRRFLKEKGMRRPSWNKSQAIQQVISLKSLLDPSPAFAAVKTANYAVTVNSNTSCSVKDRSPAEIEESVTEDGEDRCPNQHEGPEGLDFLRKGECRADDIQHDTDRCKNPPDLQVDQITIFYSGKVNVSDGIPVDKACSIMHLAASPIQFCQDEPSDENLPNANACQQPNSNVKLNLATPDAPSFQSMLADVEGQTNRQVSLRRYLDKRKDRGKFKMKRKIGTSSCPDMYLNHHLKSPVIIRQSSESNTSTTSQLGVPHTVIETKQNPLKNFGLSVDLNDKG